MTIRSFVLRQGRITAGQERAFAEHWPRYGLEVDENLRVDAASLFGDARELIAEYIDTLEIGKALDEKAVRDGFERFKAEKNAKALADIAAKHSLDLAALQTFVETTLRRMVFDGDQLSDLFAPLELGWKARAKAEQALMQDLMPELKKQAQEREISGLKAYEQ